jgi:hypothetical protein
MPALLSWSPIVMWIGAVLQNYLANAWISFGQVAENMHV